MSKIAGLIKALFEPKSNSRDGDEAYLAEAVDLYDLERRMHEVDVRGSHSSSALTNTLGLR